MPNKIGNEVTCSYCGKTWKVRSKSRWISCGNCLNKTRNTKVNKDESIINIEETMKKLNVDPEHIYQEVVSPTKNGANIKANSKYIGKVATIIIDKKDRMGNTDKDNKETAEFWDKHSI